MEIHPHNNRDISIMLKIKKNIERIKEKAWQIIKMKLSHIRILFIKIFAQKFRKKFLVLKEWEHEFINNKFGVI